MTGTELLFVDKALETISVSLLCFQKRFAAYV